MKRAAALVAGLLLGALGASARAADLDELKVLLDETVVSTASQESETTAAAPAMSTTITADEMSRLGIRSLDEAITYLGVGVFTLNPLDTVQIGARGVLLPQDRGSHFLLLVDGHRLNEPLHGSARFDRGVGVPFELIDHIEVIVGPGSVLYGSNAMFGVINIITKRAADAPRAIAAASLSPGQSFRLTGGASARVEALGRPADLVLQVEYFRQDGPDFAFGPQNSRRYIPTHTRFRPDGSDQGIWGGVATNAHRAEIPSGYLRLDWAGFRLRVGAVSHTRARPYTAEHDPVLRNFDDPETYDRDRSVNFDVAHRRSLSRLLALDTRLYLDLADSRRNWNSSALSACAFDGVAACHYRSVGRSRSAGLELQATLDWFGNGEWQSLLGTDVTWRAVAAKSDVRDGANGRPLLDSYGVINRRDALAGLYLQQTWKPGDWLNANGGIRLDLDPRFAPVASPRAAVISHLWRGGHVKLLYAEAFRAPTIYESTYRSLNQIPARALRPERVRSVEAIVEQRFGSHRVFAGLFQTWWTDLVQLAQLTPAEIDKATEQGLLEPLRSSRASQYRNIAAINDVGINAGWTGRFSDQVRAGASLTATHARTRGAETDGELPAAPQLYGNAHLSFAPGGLWPTVGAAVAAIAPRLVDRARYFPDAPPAPAAVNLHGSLHGRLGRSTGWHYRFNVDGATHERGAYVVGPLQHAVEDWTRPELNPVDQLRFTIEISYVFSP